MISQVKSHDKDTLYTKSEELRNEGNVKVCQHVSLHSISSERHHTKESNLEGGREGGREEGREGGRSGEEEDNQGERGAK